MKQPNYRRKVKRVLEQVRRKYNLSGEFTKADFLRICEAERIYTAELELNNPGYYFNSTELGKSIYIKLSIPRSERLEVAARLLGNHFLHSKGIKKGIYRNDKAAVRLAQIEADIFSEMLLGRSILDAEILENILDAEVIQ